MPRPSSPPPRRYPRRRHTNRTASIDTPQHLSDDDSVTAPGLPKLSIVSPSEPSLATPGGHVAEPGSLTPLTDTETLLNTPQATPAAMEDCVRPCGAREVRDERERAPSVSVTFAAFERVERAVSEAFEGLTWYGELRDAQRAESTQMFNDVLVSLRREWYAVGGAVSRLPSSSSPLLTSASFSSSPSSRECIPRLEHALSDARVLVWGGRVDATVLGFSHDNIFPVDTVAKRALIVSSIAAALGIVFDAWFLLAYSNTSGRRFQVRPSSLFVLSLLTPPPL